MALQYLDLEGLKRFWDNTQNYIDKADTEIKDDLKATAEDLQSKIDAITGGSGGGAPSLETLQAAINSEISRAEEAEKTLQDNIDKEVTAREEADSALSERIDNLSTSSSEGLNNLRNEIYGEEVASVPAEFTLKSIKDSLDDETGTNRPAAIQKAVDDITGTEEDSIDTLTLHGLKNLITHEAEESDGAVNELRKEVLGSTELVENKIPEGYTLTDLKSALEEEASLREEKDDALLGTPEDDKALNTIHGLRNQITFESSEAAGAVNSLREETLGDSSLLSDGKIPSTHTLDSLEKRIEAEETRATTAESGLQASIEKEIRDRTDADSALKKEIYGKEVPAEGLGNDTLTQLRSDLTTEISNRESSLTELEKRIYGAEGQVDADHTLTHLESTKVEIEGGTANNLTVNGLTASAIAGNVVDLRNATTRVKTLTEEEAQADKTENQGTAAASIQFVSDVVNSRISTAQALIYKGQIGTKEELEKIVEPLVGWLYRVSADIDFSNQSYINNPEDEKQAHKGDMLICQAAGTLGNTAKWDIVKHNDDGQVIGPTSSAADRIAVFADATGQVIKSSDKTVTDIYTEIGQEIDTDVANLKAELMGDGSVADDTIKGVKKYTDDLVNSTKLSTVNIPVSSGDSDPNGSFANNELTINLPKYRLESQAAKQDINEVKLSKVIDGVEESFTFNDNKIELNLHNYLLESKLGNIEGTIESYVQSKIGESSITSGSITHTTGDTNDETVTFEPNKININLRKYALQSGLSGAETRLDTVESQITELQPRVASNETKLSDVVDTTVGQLIDADVSAAKASLIGTDSDLSTADTIFGAKKKADEVKQELQASIDNLDGETIKTIKITEDAGSDAAPSVVETPNTVTIHLPDYRLESEAKAADITTGVLTKIDDAIHEDVTVGNNKVEVKLHNYTLQSAHNALANDVDSLETLTAGNWEFNWGGDESLTTTNTIQEYILGRTGRIDDSQITDFMKSDLDSVK